MGIFGVSGRGSRSCWVQNRRFLTNITDTESLVKGNKYEKKKQEINLVFELKTASLVDNCEGSFQVEKLKIIRSVNTIPVNIHVKVDGS